MPLYDYRCEGCGETQEDRWFPNATKAPETVGCGCGGHAGRWWRMRKQNGIHLSHSGMYGKYHPGFGEVVESYEHKQRLHKKYGTIDAHDTYKGSRHITPATDNEPTPVDISSAGVADSPDAAIAAAEKKLNG